MADGPPSATPWAQKLAAAAAARHLTHVFSTFYKDSTGQFYHANVEQSDLAPEDDTQAFVVFNECPTLDAASYHDVDSSAYSADRNGVYYACLAGHEVYFQAVPGADPVTFRVLPDLEAGYDRAHVFLRTQQLPALRPAGLRVYEGPENSPIPCGADDLYFTDGRVVVKNEEVVRRVGRAFQPPAAYKKVYPKSAAAP